MGILKSSSQLCFQRTHPIGEWVGNHHIIDGILKYYFNLAHLGQKNLRFALARDFPNFGLIPADQVSADPVLVSQPQCQGDVTQHF